MIAYIIQETCSWELHNVCCSKLIYVMNYSLVPRCLHCASRRLLQWTFNGIRIFTHEFLVCRILSW